MEHPSSGQRAPARDADPAAPEHAACLPVQRARCGAVPPCVRSSARPARSPTAAARGLRARERARLLRPLRAAACDTAHHGLVSTWLTAVHVLRVGEQALDYLEVETAGKRHVRKCHLSNAACSQHWRARNHSQMRRAGPLTRGCSTPHSTHLGRGAPSRGASARVRDWRDRHDDASGACGAEEDGALVMVQVC